MYPINPAPQRPSVTHMSKDNTGSDGSSTEFGVDGYNVTNLSLLIKKSLLQTEMKHYS